MSKSMWTPVSCDFTLFSPGSHDSMSFCLDVSSPVLRSEPGFLRLTDRLFPCCTRPCVSRWATTQVQTTHSFFFSLASMFVTQWLQTNAELCYWMGKIRPTCFKYILQILLFCINIYNENSAFFKWDSMCCDPVSLNQCQIVLQNVTNKIHLVFFLHFSVFYELGFPLQ